MSHPLGASDATEIKAHQEPPVDFVPGRVVSLVPSLTESLFDLDLGSRLVAVTEYCTRPARQTQPLNRREDAAALQAAGVPVWITGPRSVADALSLLWQIMDVFDHAVMVPRVREIERAYDYTLAAARAMQPARVFVPIWREPWMTFNAETYAHDVLRVCGGENVFANRKRRFPLAADLGTADPLPDDHPDVKGRDRRYPRVALEEIVASQPEIVLLPDEPFAFAPEDVETIARLDIPAARSGCIYLIDGSILTWHGTRVAYALRDLPALLMGEE